MKILAVIEYLANRAERCDPGCPGWFRNSDTGEVERCDECAGLNGVDRKLGDHDIDRALRYQRAYEVTATTLEYENDDGSPRLAETGIVGGCCIDQRDTYTVLTYDDNALRCGEVPTCARCCQRVLEPASDAIVHDGDCCRWARP